jgi:hypothetical protein
MQTSTQVLFIRLDKIKDSLFLPVEVIKENLETN